MGVRSGSERFGYQPPSATRTVKLKPFWPARVDAGLFSWKEIYHLTLAADAKQAEAKAAAESGAQQHWPTDDELRVPFRVVTQHGASLDILRSVQAMSNRFPSDGFDVSDAAAIERFVKRVESGEIGQKTKRSGK